MLEEVKIAGEATYSAEGQTLTNLKNINFIFGTNGSGKTTISRVIRDPAKYPSSELIWKNSHPIETLVYNSDFARDNYASEMPGIFTLGKASKDALDEIEEGVKKVAELRGRIEGLENTLGPSDNSTGKRAELRALREAFEADCWRIKGLHDAYFQEAFAGVRNSKERFCDRVLSELSTNVAKIFALDDLKAKALTIFDRALERLELLLNIDARELIALERSAVLSKNVVGKDDVNLAALIRRLGNSDWVRQGLGYIGDRDSQCPFCQQDITAGLYKELNEYFDETFLSDMDAIEKTCSAYEVYSSDVLSKLESVVSTNSRYIDAEALRTDIDRLRARLELNKRTLDRKKKEPSSPITLDGVGELVAALKDRIDTANTKIAEHNEVVDNLASEKNTLKSEIWKCLIEESKPLLEAYTAKKKDLDKAISGLMTAIEMKRAEEAAVRSALRELEKKVTSVHPTVDAINGTLSSFGFSSFKLTTAGENKNRYAIIRSDGTDAAKTLSEGEKNFIIFLYFYHLVRGSQSESGATTDRVVVFDDPVSSLDNDVLFIVSTLIKDVLAEACAGVGRIKQVFVLTHNIYFHKEVSFDSKRSTECRAHETFWIVRKIDRHSELKNYTYNPIKTSYELLWNEVKSGNRSNITIQNTLRRIIENYFKILGNIDTTKIISLFDGRDQQICASLFSWVNDGSHSVHDDVYVSADDEIVSRYLKVFKRIFEKTDHMGHYRMMMGADGDIIDTALEGPVV